MKKAITKNSANLWPRHACKHMHTYTERTDSDKIIMCVSHNRVQRQDGEQQGSTGVSP